MEARLSLERDLPPHLVFYLFKRQLEFSLGKMLLLAVESHTENRISNPNSIFEKET